MKLSHCYFLANNRDMSDILESLDEIASSFVSIENVGITRHRYGNIYKIPASAKSAKHCGQMNPHTVRYLLSKYVESPETLCNFLHTTGNAIVGSLALQIVLGTKYEQSDMDLYVARDYIFDAIVLLEKQGYRMVRDQKTHGFDTVEDNHNVGGSSREEDYITRMDVDLRRLENDEGSTIDVLSLPCSVDCCYGAESCVLAFDLTCCMCFFNSRRVYSYFYDLTIRGISILCKSSDSIGYSRTKKRVDKYESRGFCIIHCIEDLPLELIEECRYPQTKVDIGVQHTSLDSQYPEGSPIMLYSSIDMRMYTYLNIKEILEHM